MLVDDHELIRQGVRGHLERRTELSVVAEAGTVRQALIRAAKERPDVIVMDIQLPDGSGIEACRAIKADLPETKLIMLTGFANDEAVMSSIMAGASAFLLKTTPGEEIAAAIEKVAAGESLLDPGITKRLLDQVREMVAAPRQDDQPKLSENENKILERIAEGKTNREIAAEVFLSEKTVKKYVSNILDKLDLRRRSEAAAYIARRSMNQPRR
ncbi:MAG TPA: response regulator transcription factor [Dehalococcoidia bacterium]|jgi:DNA-binding NarL/FixJ family response regulator|nr:response regulator transcription factor [Dehalococcoidia bacterium]